MKWEGQVGRVVTREHTLAAMVIYLLLHHVITREQMLVEGEEAEGLLQRVVVLMGEHGGVDNKTLFAMAKRLLELYEDDNPQ